MEHLKCPLCSDTVTIALDQTAWFETAERVILGHTPGSDAVLDGRAVKHLGSALCLGSGCSVSLAEGIAADRKAGVPQRAHP
jgi:hypothetical protein